MEHEDQNLKDALDTDPDLLNFDLDDDSLAETALEDASQEDEIIELVDVIKRGKYDPDRFGDTKEFRHLFDEDVSSSAKTSDSLTSKIKWAKEFEEEEAGEEFAAGETRSTTIEIKETDLIYEDDPSAEDIVDVAEKDLLQTASADEEESLEEDILELQEENVEIEAENENGSKNQTGELDGDFSDIPEIDLDEITETEKEDTKPIEPIAAKGEEAFSEKELEDVLEGASPDEIDIDFEEETTPKAKPVVESKPDEALNLEEELEKALEDATIEEDEVEDKSEKEDLEESLQKLFDEDDEQPLVKIPPKKPVKETQTKREANATPADSVKEKGDISKAEIEAFIAREIRVAVEKVARETMSNVAEKFIGEAISSLKKSLDSSSD